MRTNKFMVAALDAAAENTVSWENGRDVYEEEIENGNSLEDAIYLALDAAAETKEAWSEGLVAFDNAVAKQKLHRKVLFGTLLVLLIAVVVWFANPSTTAPTEDKTHEAAVKTAQAVLEKADWKDDQYKIDAAVDESLDKSTAAANAFDLAGVRTSAGMVAFLQSDSEEAKVVLGQISKSTEGTKKQAINGVNWVQIQSNVPFTYPGNTGFKDGNIFESGERTGMNGDIFLMFVNPDNGKVFVIRAACANPQTVIPTPTPLESKDPSKDVLANKNVENWKKNSNGEKAVATSEDFQANPVKDAADAAADAKVAADKAATEADAARDAATNSGAGVVDSGTGYTEVPDPVKVDPNW